MTPQPNLLKVLLTERHLQNHRAFCREYDKQAAHIDPSLVGTYPSRAQFYRWTSREISGLPYPDHCRVLEAIFRGHTALDLFGDPGQNGRPDSSETARSTSTAEIVATALRGQLRSSDLETVWTGSERHGPQWWDTERQGKSVGLPPRITELNNGHGGTDRLPDARFLTAARTLRLTDQETIKIAHLRGNIVELRLSVFLDIQPDGWADVTYDHTILNMASRPLSRLVRETWFENTLGPIDIKSSFTGGHTVAIERIHDTKNLAKFACHLDPPLAQCAHMDINYTCRGGRFVADHYWRQLFPRYTRWATIQVRHQGASPLTALSVSEEHPDGFVSSADEFFLGSTTGRMH